MDMTTLPIQPPAALPAQATDAQRAQWLDQWRVVAMFAQVVATERLAASNEAGQEARDKHAQAQTDTATALKEAAGAQVNAARILAGQDRPTPAQMAQAIEAAFPGTFGG